MASVFKQKGRTIWQMEFKDQHGVIRKGVSTRMKDKRLAEGIAHMVERDAVRIRAGLQPLEPSITGTHLGLVQREHASWKWFRARYETEVLPGMRPRTAEKCGTVFDVFEEEVKPTRLQTIYPETLSRFVAALRQRPVKNRGKLTGKVGLAPWTIKNYLICLKTALGWAHEQKLIMSIPTFPTVKVPKLKPQPIGEGDWEKRYAAAPDDLWRAYLLCGWWGGLRLSEASHLRRTRSEESPWLDLDADRIVLPARFVKAGEDQWVPLHPKLREALAALPLTGDEMFPFRSRRAGNPPLSRNGITNRVIDMARKAGVKLSMHRLRKGFGCRVAQQLGKGNAPVLHRLMRHSSMQVTMDFYASVDDVLHDAIKQLDPEPAKGNQEDASDRRVG